MQRATAIFLAAACTIVTAEAVKAADPRASQLTYQPWTKSCAKAADGAQICFLAAGARGACYPSGGSLSISLKDDKTGSLFASLGTKRMLVGAIIIRVDHGDPILIPHPNCRGIVCSGSVAINDEFVERLKHSQTITIEATDKAYGPPVVSLSLADFSAAYDGPGVALRVEGKMVTREQMKESAKQSEAEKPPQCED